MKIKTVTFTGADDKTVPFDLFSIWRDNKFVEWGILYSETGGGRNRYPKFAKFMELMELPCNTSAHLCGKVVRELIVKGKVEQDMRLLTVLNACQRVQLNFNATKITPNLYLMFAYLNKYNLMGKPIIFQANKANKRFIDAVAPFTDNDFHYLFDASGGRGTEIATISEPIPGKHCGYAGGLNPDNLAEKLALLDMNLPVDQEIWIDMESGVRTSDMFDLDKVQKCIEIVKPYTVSKK